MITKEEYKKTFVRMMDSVRTSYKGQKGCAGVDHSDCPFKSLCDKCDDDISDKFLAMEYIEAVEQWGKDHPVFTNGEKFMEVFKTKPRSSFGCFRPDSVECPNILCQDCKFGVNGEYKEGDIKE